MMQCPEGQKLSDKKKCSKTKSNIAAAAMLNTFHKSILEFLPEQDGITADTHPVVLVVFGPMRCAYVAQRTCRQKTAAMALVMAPITFVCTALRSNNEQLITTEEANITMHTF